MHSSLKASLEQAIEAWANKLHESDNPHLPTADGLWWDEDLVSHMTDAAEVVFDASFSSSRFTLDQQP